MSAPFHNAQNSTFAIHILCVYITLITRPFYCDSLTCNVLGFWCGVELERKKLSLFALYVDSIPSFYTVVSISFRRKRNRFLILNFNLVLALCRSSYKVEDGVGKLIRKFGSCLKFDHAITRLNRKERRRKDFCFSSFFFFFLRCMHTLLEAAAKPHIMRRAD